MELMQNQKEQRSGVVKRAEETGQNFQGKSLSKCGKWNEFDSNGCFRVREYNQMIPENYVMAMPH